MTQTHNSCHSSTLTSFIILKISCAEPPAVAIRSRFGKNIPSDIEPYKSATITYNVRDGCRGKMTIACHIVFLTHFTGFVRMNQATRL